LLERRGHRGPVNTPGAVQGCSRCQGSDAKSWPHPCARCQITRFGGSEVLDVGDLPDPVPGDGEQLYEVSSAEINFADTHHSPS